MKRFFALFAALTLLCTGISAQTAACRTETGIAYRDAAGDGFESFYREEPIRKVESEKLFPSTDGDYSERINLIAGRGQTIYSYCPLPAGTAGNSPESSPLLTDGKRASTPSYTDSAYFKFGSGEGQSKLCKNKRMLYILREGELFPITLSLPTGSLKSFTNYVKSQLSRGRKLNQVVTKITLKKATNASGIAFSQAVFAFERMLTAEERNAVAGVSETVKAYAANLTTASLIDDEPLVDPETGEIIEPLK